MTLVRCVPATQGVQAVLTGSRKAGLPARAHRDFICHWSRCVRRARLQGARGAGREAGVDTEQASPSGGQGAGGDSQGQPFAGPGPAATRRLDGPRGGRQGQGQGDCSGLFKTEGQGHRGGPGPEGPHPSRAQRASGQTQLSCLFTCFTLLSPGAPERPGVHRAAQKACFAASRLPDTEPGSKGSEKAEWFLGVDLGEQLMRWGNTSTPKSSPPPSSPESPGRCLSLPAALLRSGPKTSAVPACPAMGSVPLKEEAPAFSLAHTAPLPEMHKGAM